jgi:tetratricopeptide (TPR) repeat protein
VTTKDSSQQRQQKTNQKEASYKMNSFDVVFNELKKSGIGVDIKRKGDDGVLRDAKQNELASLGTKATVASTAALLKKLNPEEKLTWAIETKNEANELYKQKMFQEAMGKYVESLAGSDFGDKEPNSSNKGNVDSLVVPVLCNLAACCLQVEEWGKAVSFGDQAVLLRPQCSKAHMRKGIGLMHLGEHELALDCYALAQSTATNKPKLDDDSTEVTPDRGQEEPPAVEGEGNNQHATLSETDWRRLPSLILQAKRGMQQHRKQMKERKEALASAFKKNSGSTSAPAVSQVVPSMPVVAGPPSDSKVAPKKDPTGQEKIKLMSFVELLMFFLQMFIDFFSSFTKPKAD